MDSRIRVGDPVWVEYGDGGNRRRFTATVSKVTDGGFIVSNPTPGWDELRGALEPDGWTLRLVRLAEAQGVAGAG